MNLLHNESYANIKRKNRYAHINTCIHGKVSSDQLTNNFYVSQLFNYYTQTM